MKLHKIQKLVLFVLLSLLVLLIFVGCKDKDTNKGKIEINISSVDELISIRDKLGPDYDKATFNLTTDLNIDIEWTPIGDSVENSFRSTFNGNNHTITISSNISADRNLSVFGLFGYIYNATFNDLKLNVDFENETLSEVSYVGALASFGIYTNSFKNITIDGNITHSAGWETYRSPYSGIIEPRNNKYAFIGGVIGYAVGESSFSDITSNLEVNVSESNDNNYGIMYGFNRIFSGCIAGYVRTTDLSDTNKERNNVEKIQALPNFTINALAVFAGGAFGFIYNAKINDLIVGNESYPNISKITVAGRRHTYAGGAFGLLDNSNATNINVFLDLDVSPSGDKNTANSFGGISAYINNGAVLDNAKYKGDIHTAIGNISQSYAGGLAGTISNSTVQNSTTSGRFIIANVVDSVDRYYSLIARSNSPYQSYMIANYAGVTGRIHGNSCLDSIESEYLAYQGVYSELATVIEVVDLDGDKIVQTVGTPTVNKTTKFDTANAAAYLYDESNEKFMPIYPYQD
ncbi:MAG: hypothetical protein LBU04_05795 [Christensenellaceae bacterium]|nr:hypothetical protein [Christensenellaceae bacterium]